MAKRLVTILPGEGIGPEVMSATLRVLEAMHVPLEWDIMQSLGMGDTLNPAAIKSLEKTGLGLKGPTASVGHRSYNVQLRERFDLFANVRPVHTIPGIPTIYGEYRHIDLFLVRENLQDLYIGEERLIADGAEAISRMTRTECRRVALFAFEAAVKRAGQKKVTLVHKTNILPLTYGILLEEARQVALLYPDVEFDSLQYADSVGMRLVMHPERFDVVLMPNMFGDLLSDIAAGLVGGLGFAAGWNKGPKVSVFETVGGTAPDIADTGTANPAAMLFTGCMLLEHGVNLYREAGNLRQAIYRVLESGIVTKDVNPEHYVSTEDFASAVIAAL